MKATNGWSRPQTRGGGGGMGRGQRRPNSGSYSPKYPRGFHGHGHRQARNPFFEAIKERLSFTFRNLAGKKVVLKKSNGMVLEGILIASNQESAAGRNATLQYVTVKSRPEGNSEDIPSGPAKLTVEWNDLAYIYGANVSESTASNEFSNQKLKLDSDISKKSIQSGSIANRQLKAPDAGWLQDSASNGALHFNPNEKPGKWDQFKTNEEKFGVKNTFDENLYTMKLDKSVLTPEQIKAAEKTAREIEGSSSSNPHLKEERNHKPEKDQGDEESRYSSVNRAKASKDDSSAGSSSKKPLSFAAALMKGKALPPPSIPPYSQMWTGSSKTTSISSSGKNISSIKPFKTPTKASIDGTKKAGHKHEEKSVVTPAPLTPIVTPGDDSKEGPSSRVSRADKYKVSTVDFEAQRKVQQMNKELHTPTTKNWESHAFTRQRMEMALSKSRTDQIAEFKNFSTSLTKKGKSPEGSVSSKTFDGIRKQLNVNAKEFKPPAVKPAAKAPAQVSNKSNSQSDKGKNQGQNYNQNAARSNNSNSNNNTSNGNATPAPPQSVPSVTSTPQPFNSQPVFPVPVQQFPQGYPVNMIPQPMMVPGHAPHQNIQMFPQMMQNPQMVFPPGMQGQPYFVQMMPQMQQNPNFNFQQPRIVYGQVPPGVVQMPANGTQPQVQVDPSQMQPQIMHMQPQQIQQLQQQAPQPQQPQGTGN